LENEYHMSLEIKNSIQEIYYEFLVVLNKKLIIEEAILGIEINSMME
jgi:hypothetical protein